MGICGSNIDSPHSKSQKTPDDIKDSQYQKQNNKNIHLKLASEFGTKLPVARKNNRSATQMPDYKSKYLDKSPKPGTAIQSGLPNFMKKDSKDEISNFKRKEKKSISLVDKCKFGSRISAEEIKLCVNNEQLIKETQGMAKSKYKIISRLGEGSYGSVFLVYNPVTKCEVAMKKIKKIKENEIDDMEIKNEIEILKKLDHPNIVKIFEF